MSYSPYLLKGQKALVTVACSGIGQAIARYLALSGAAVAIDYHSEAESAQKIVNNIIVLPLVQSKPPLINQLGILQRQKQSY